MRDDNQAFYRAFSSLPAPRQAEILRDSAQYFRDHKNEQQAQQLEAEAFYIENWSNITKGVTA